MFLSPAELLLRYQQGLSRRMMWQLRQMSTIYMGTMAGDASAARLACLTDIIQRCRCPAMHLKKASLMLLHACILQVYNPTC